MLKHIHIIGGGVAGLSLGLNLARAGFKPVIYERRNHESFAGMGFLLTPNGVKTLKAIFGDLLWPHEEFYLSLSTLTLNHLEEAHQTHTPASEMCGVLRPLFIERLETLYQEAGGELITDVSLSSLQCSTDGHAQRLIFEGPNGQIEREAHFVIGADGARSTLRSQLFPHATLQMHPITEYVALSPIPPSMRASFNSSDASHHALVKHYTPQKRQAFGYMPLPHEQIWYAQMMRSDELPVADGEPRKRFLLERYQGWPDEVQLLLRACPFERTFRWDLSDLNIMPVCFKGGVLLIGDAAHASLTFSSQGVSSALEDGLTFCELLSSITHPTSLTPQRWHEACERFSELQTPIWRRRHSEGRALLEGFINGALTQGVPIVPS